MKKDTSPIHKYIIEASKAPEVENPLEKIVPFIDLTSLTGNETAEDIRGLCSRANNTQGSVASVCVYPQHIKLARQFLDGSKVKVASVVNFPAGDFDLKKTVAEIAHVIQEGTNEVDLVMPYKEYIKGSWSEVKEFLKACKKACGKTVSLKVILETGALHKMDLVTSATNDAINAGADFIKTSTGKIERGASLEASAAILMAIKDVKDRFGLKVGFKASGGIKTASAAICYLNLAETIMGKGWATPTVFRIGASSIV